VKAKHAIFLEKAGTETGIVPKSFALLRMTPDAAASRTSDCE
jgi:hypothetical protein